MPRERTSFPFDSDPEGPSTIWTNPRIQSEVRNLHGPRPRKRRALIETQLSLSAESSALRNPPSLTGFRPCAGPCDGRTLPNIRRTEQVQGGRFFAWPDGCAALKSHLQIGPKWLSSFDSRSFSRQGFCRPSRKKNRKNKLDFHARCDPVERRDFAVDKVL